ncbi:MAG TPA: tRNA lysidine(34) synthetase TilS [Chitinophagaceae bacterium]
MHLLQKFTDFIKKENLFQAKDRLLLAVSGGVDSVVLCELCKQAGFDFVIAHCNFQLREDESGRDEQFVRELAKKYSSEIFVKKFETEKYAEQNKLSIQVAARELRYEWFNSLIGDEIKYILTAHHANDNIETLLMNFFKGTGINGLQGILPKQANVIRPLLFAKKEEFLEFAKENGLSYVEDSSNASDKYTRNYFRNQLIPSIQKVFPQVEENLINNIQRFTEIQTLYQQSIDLHKKKLLEKKGEEIHIPVFKLLKSQPLATIVYEIVKDFGFTSNQTDEVIKLLKSDSGKYVQSPRHRVLKNRNWLIVTPVNTEISENILIEEKDKEIKFLSGKLEIKKALVAVYKLSANENIAQLDADEITFPLLLRKWKQGDYFYPLGMNKKKKLSRFFIDQKMSMTEKENTWVIEMNKKIVWVVGKRIDNRFKITGKTKNILLISLL